MTTLKQKAKAEMTDSEELMEEAFEKEVTLGDDEEAPEEVYEFLAGYMDKDGVIHKEFTFREMTGRDEEAIQKSDVRVNTSKVISTLLSRCLTRIGTITPKSVGRNEWEKIIKSLYVGDQDYALIQIRKHSIGEEMEVAHVCPNCGAKLSTVFELDELEIMPFSGDRKIEFELPRGYKDKKGVVHRLGTMRLPNGLDREILTPLAKKNPAKSETTMLTRLCSFVDGAYVDDDVMSSLVVKDREYLLKLLRESTFGVNPEVKVVCDQCGEEFTGTLNSANFT